MSIPIALGRFLVFLSAMVICAMTIKLGLFMFINTAEHGDTMVGYQLLAAIHAFAFGFLGLALICNFKDDPS